MLISALGEVFYKCPTRESTNSKKAIPYYKLLIIDSNVCKLIILASNSWCSITYLEDVDPSFIGKDEAGRYMKVVESATYCCK